MEKVLTMTQKECLQTRERESTDRIPLVTTFNPHTTFIAEIARRNWNFLQSKERLAHIFNKPPLEAYRRPISLRDRLVSAKFKTVNNTLVPKNQSAAGAKESTKPPHLPAVTTIRPLKYFTLSWVIYIIECNICNLQYIGKSETAFNLRLNKRRNQIRKVISSCELTEHFLHDKRTHNFDNNVIITIIEQIRKDNISNEQKKDLPRHREIFWQKKLNSMQPNGLDKRIGEPFNIVAVIFTKFWVHKMFKRCKGS